MRLEQGKTAKEQSKFPVLNKPMEDGKTQHFICAEEDVPFTIKIEREQEGDRRHVVYDKIYGVTLWIDGKRVPCKKTLASKFTNFLGWPLGQGLHAEFTFRVQHATGNEEGTKVIEEDRRGGKRSVFDDLDNKHKGKLGSIIIEFYETEEFVREKPAQPRKLRQEEDSLPEVSETNNKLMGYRVGKGKEFRTSELIGNRKDRRGNKSRGEFDRSERKRDLKAADKRDAKNGKQNLFAEDQEVDYRILYDREVDSVTIFYAPWASLHQRKLVDVYSYSHLKLIPANVFGSRDMIFKVFWAIVNHRGTTEVSQLAVEFRKATSRILTDYFELCEQDLIVFLRLHPNMFKIDEGKVKALQFNKEREF